MPYDLPDLPEAACREVDPEIFFGPHVCGTECDGVRGCYIARGETGRLRRIKQAKAVCFSCAERLACLTWALKTDQPFGVWGGTTERERKRLRKADRRSG